MEISIAEFFVILGGFGIFCFFIGGIVFNSYQKRKHIQPKLNYLYRYISQINGISKDLMGELEGRNNIGKK